MITKSVNAGCRSETTINTFSDHDGNPRRLELPGRPLATHTLWSHSRHPTPHDNTDDSPTVALPCNANDPRRPKLSGIDSRPGVLAVLGFLTALGLAAVIIYYFLLILATTAFWFVRVDTSSRRSTASTRPDGGR
jgi:hypothetical protein